MPFHGKYGIELRPVITSALTASGTTGVPFSYTITATNTPTSFNATGLPAGLSINTSTGLISGTPTGPAVTDISLTATNGFGTLPPVILVLTVTGAPKNLSKTKIHNSGDTRFIGYLPPHGSVMASGDDLTIDGDLRTVLAVGPGKRYSGRSSLDALDADIANGDIVITEAG